MPSGPARTHDLLRLHEPAALAADLPTPTWVEPALSKTPWVVMRRGIIRDGMIPVGVRGLTRSQRFAAFVAVDAIAERLTPEDLTEPRFVDPRRQDTVPALAALVRVAPILASRRFRWGPGGSVGFEIATCMPTATESSDLDIILRQDVRLEPSEARELHLALAETAFPARIDVILETPSCGVLLADLAAASLQVLVRTPKGPRLSTDPWRIDGAFT